MWKAEWERERGERKTAYIFSLWVLQEACVLNEHVHVHLVCMGQIISLCHMCKVILTWDHLRSDQRRAPLRLGGDLNMTGDASFPSSADNPGRFFEEPVTCCVYNIALSLQPYRCGKGIVNACCCCLPLLPRVLETMHVRICKVWVNTNARGILFLTMGVCEDCDDCTH